MRRPLVPLLALGLLLPAGAPSRAQDAAGDSLPPGAVARLGTLRLAHPGGVTALAFAPDARLLATGGTDRTVRLWDVASGREVRRLTGHKDAVCAVAFLAGGKTLVSGSTDGGIL